MGDAAAAANAAAATATAAAAAVDCVPSAEPPVPADSAFVSERPSASGLRLVAAVGPAAATKRVQMLVVCWMPGGVVLRLKLSEAVA